MGNQATGRRISDAVPPYPFGEDTPVNEAPADTSVDSSSEPPNNSSQESTNGSEALTTGDSQQARTDEPPQSAGEATPESRPSDTTDTGGESTADHSTGEPTGSTPDSASSAGAGDTETPWLRGHNQVIHSTKSMV